MKHWQKTVLGAAIGALVGIFLKLSGTPELEGFLTADPVYAAGRLFGAAAFVGIIGAVCGSIGKRKPKPVRP
jgi:hypothetical protein